jgi:large subunit ribosomal protein L30
MKNCCHSGSGSKVAKKNILKITLIKSPIGYSKRQKGTIRALGLKKINQTVEQEDSPVIRGMITKVSHLIKVEE